jgi:phage shock protein A
METAKLRRFKKKLKAREEQLIRELDEVQENVHELEQNVRKTVQAGKEKLHGL